jgi:serine/threonine protein kinase
VNESQVFTQALKLATPAERAAYLDEACAGNSQLRADVEALLGAHAADPAFLEQPIASPERTVDAPAAGARLGEPVPEPSPTEHPGAVLGGRYKLLEQIGEGGMGTVWMAQQQEPVRRPVAVKVIKPGMDSKQVLARFEAERQAVALMDHPNIARVLDADTTAGARPYFVMELVKGVPLTRYCDEHRLTPRQRLELFVPVCQAIQHAHQKGVIHRDVKPSNVLVASYDGKPVPKVIDFGIAKATGQQLTEHTLVTGFGSVVGTLEYMSPEQAELNQIDIDTRSDIYSLGVLLYELLTGTTPLEKKRLKETALLEALRIIREEEPPRPSTRLSDSKDSLPSISAQRQMEPAKLTRLVRGELDWIAMKALEKDRNRRYESASAFAADVQRYLHDEPVQACPPTVGYRLRKFVRRNKGPVLAGSVVLLTLLAGVIATSIGLVLAEEARRDESAQRVLAQINEGKANAAAEQEHQANLAAQEAAEHEREAKERAQKAERATKEQSAITEAVNSFFQGLLAQADIANQPLMIDGLPVARNPNLTVRELLDRAAKQIEGNFAEQELTEAAIQLTMGNAYLWLGEYAEAEKHLDRSLQLRTAKLAADHPDILNSKYSRAVLYYLQGKYPQAEALYQAMLALETAKLGADHLNTLHTKNSLALLYNVLGKYA